MNKKLILLLSLFGIAMAFISTYWITSTAAELSVWFVILLACAYVISTKCSQKYFLNGFVTGILCSLFVTAAHIWLFDDYANHHLERVLLFSNMPMSPRTGMAALSPAFAIVSGLALGLFSFIASKIVKSPTPAAA
ncbi:MAG TPA: hypothetical protein VI757_14135 [Bacteroidia bacterium]|nr:hypothetical protein [Bacteroidia bacterium]